MKNVADTWKSNQSKTDFELYGRFSGFFRTPTPYVPKNPSRPPQLTADEQKKLDQKDRFCLNWACGKIFKGKDNKRRTCRCHPGKWDFGYSG